MAGCEFCGQEMTNAVSCTVRVFNDFIDGVPRDRVRYGDETGAAHVDYDGRERLVEMVRDVRARQKTCGDCATPIGSFHHPGCDLEQCPRCTWQAFSCGCTADFVEERLADEYDDPEERDRERLRAAREDFSAQQQVHTSILTEVGPVAK